MIHLYIAENILVQDPLKLVPLRSLYIVVTFYMMKLTISAEKFKFTQLFVLTQFFQTVKVMPLF